MVGRPAAGSSVVIIHLTAPAEAGGLERVAQALAAGQRRRGHGVVVAAVVDARSQGSAFLDPLSQAGVSTLELEVPRRGYRAERAMVRDLLTKRRPHVVHTHGYRPDVVDAGVARACGASVVTTVHGFTGGGWKNWV